MKLYNDTLLGSYLAHVHSNIRELAALDFEKANHPDNLGIPVPMSATRLAMRDEWENLRTQVADLLDLHLKPFSQLAEPGVCDTDSSEPRSWRWNFKAIKKLADKHRRRHPEFSMLGSWDVASKDRPY